MQVVEGTYEPSKLPLAGHKPLAVAMLYSQLL